MHAIGIDIGTTSICGVLLDARTGKLIKRQTIMSNAFIPTENSWEKIQDTEKLISISKEILDGLLDEETVVIGLTGQMHGIVYTDENGNALSPLYTWQDERGNLPYRDTTYAKYMDSFAGYGNVTDFYNRENGLRPKEAVSYCTIQDYLGMVLCGRKRPVLHSSNAASFGCFDAEKITDEYRLLGEYKKVPVAVAIGDNQASVFSTLTDESGILINIGTGSQITVVSDKPVTGENIEVRPYVEGKYLVVGAALCGGRAYSMVKDFFKEIIQAAGGDASDVYGIMEQMLQDKSETTLKVDTRFAGTRTSPCQKGSINGIDINNFTPGELAFGILEGMTNELLAMYRSMGVQKSGIVGSGNAIRHNRKLIEIIEKRFAQELKIPMHEEEAAYGAALFALVACGIFKNAAEVQKLIHYTKLL